ncbi:CPBP family intramembrane glutamic endopeptidase [Companilactobacillus paralimentarius]|uniref:CPBP family intramembrane glutamic endopeptidase n=1 Tax=Companilactobacillus paralimentarius TaxID=83526 RepID=UPI0034E51978
MFRGIILGSLLNDNSENINKGNLLYCLITSSALFALYHIGNIQSQNLTMTIMQVFETFGMGCLFGAIYIRKGSILLSFLLHFFIDFTGTIGNGQIVNNSPSQYKYSIVVSLLYMVVLSIIAFNILKINDKSKWEFPIKDSSLNQ